MVLRLRSDLWLAELQRLCLDCLPPGATVVELGSFAGESTIVFAEHAKALFAVDLWAASYREDIIAGCKDYDLVSFLKATPIEMSEIKSRFLCEAGKLPQVRVLEADAVVAAQMFGFGTIDLVYIDTIHDYGTVAALIDAWIAKVRPGGFLSGHDYDVSTWPEVVAAVNDRFGRPDAVYGDTSWCVRI